MTGEPGAGRPFYSQVTAAAMHDRIERQRERMRGLWRMIGILHREADKQAETIEQLREDVERWRSLYISAIAYQKKLDPS